MITMEQGEPYATQDLHVAVALIVHPQRVAQLSHREQERGGRHEADDDRLGNVASQVAQFEQADDDLEDANQHGQQEQPLEEFLGVLRVEEGKRREDQQRDGASRSVDQMRRRTEDRGDDRYDDRRVHAEPGIHPRDQRISHRLRERNRRDSEAGNNVVPAFDQVVIQRKGHRVPLRIPMPRRARLRCVSRIPLMPKNCSRASLQSLAMALTGKSVSGGSRSVCFARISGLKGR